MENNQNDSSKIINNDTTQKKKNKKLYLFIKILVLIIYLVIVISTEVAYRKKLFNKSLEYEADIREKHERDSGFYKSFKFFSTIGTFYVCIGIFFIIFLFFPINYSFTAMSSLNLANYLTNFLKMIYRNPRPYWEVDILDIVCNSGYGNPSGHSLVCLSFFLTTSHIVTNFNFFKTTQKGKILRIVIFCVLILIAALVIISRVIVAAHSINQIIYGTLLGIGVYFIEIHILSYHTYASEKFIEHMYNIKYLVIYLSIYAGAIILLIIIYFSISDDEEIEKLIYDKVFNGEKCDFKRKYQVLKNDGFTQALSITSMLGLHIGFFLLIHILKKLKYSIEYLNEFNQSSVKRWFIRLPILIISAIFLILYFVIPKKSPLAIIIIFKFALAFFLTSFGLYFVGIFFCVYFNFSNEKIMKLN